MTYCELWKKNIKEYKNNAEISPLIFNELSRLYENGEFDSCQKKINSYMVENTSYNSYLLLLSLSCEILIKSNLHQIIKFMENIIPLLEDIDKKSIVVSTLSLNGVCGFIVNGLSYKLAESRESRSKNDINNLNSNIEKLADLLSSWSLNNWRHDKQFIECRKNLYKLTEKNNKKTEKTKTIDNDSIKNEPDKIQTSEDSNYIDKFASIEWYKLIKKIKLIRVLLKDNKYFETAIIYKDLEEEIKNFDPKYYFPGLFFDLFKEIAPKLSRIYRFSALHNESLQWHIAENLYQTDPDRFVKELDKLISNTQPDEEFTEYQSEDLDRNISLIDPEYINDDNDLEFKHIDSTIDNMEINQLQDQIDIHQQQIIDDPDVRD